MSFKFQALTRLFRSSRLWAAERAIESIEYLGLTAALVALLGGVGVAFDRGGAQRLGAEVVHTMVCWVSYLSGEAECPPSQEVAAAPPQPLPTLVPTPCPYLACEPPPKSEPPEPEGHRPPKEPLLSWLLEKLGLAGEAGQEWVERFGEYLKTLPEEERGAVLAGLLPFLLFLTLLGVGLTLGGPAAILGAAGLLASALAGWLYGSGHPGGFNNLAATLSGLSAWLLVVFGLDALGRLALRVRERRRAAHLAKLLPQGPPPGEDLWDKALLILGGIALAEPTPFGEVGWLGLVGFRALVLFAAGGLAFSLSRPVDYSRFPTSSYSTTVAQQVPSRDSLAAEVQLILAERQRGEGQAAQTRDGGQTAFPSPPQGPEWRELYEQIEREHRRGVSRPTIERATADVLSRYPDGGMPTHPQSGADLVFRNGVRVDFTSINAATEGALPNAIANSIFRKVAVQQATEMHVQLNIPRAWLPTVERLVGQNMRDYVGRLNRVVLYDEEGTLLATFVQ